MTDGNSVRARAGGGGPESSVRYQPDERPPEALAFGLGLQMAILQIAGIVLTPAIVIRAAGLGEPYLSWAVFAALTDESEISLRLLRHYASSVRHQKYPDVDIVTVEVEGRSRAG